VRLRGSLGASGSAALVDIAMMAAYRRELETTNEFLRIRF